MIKKLALFALLLSSAYAQAQSISPNDVNGPVRQYGSITVGHCASWTSNNTIQDAGACGGGGGGSGTVTSVTFTGDGTVLSSTPSSAVTTSGTLTATLANQTANTVLGALTATTPSDLALPSCSAATSALTWTSGIGFGCHTIAGGVTSVSGDGNLVSNSSSTGAVALTLANAAANTVWGNNTSSSAAPGYQTMVMAQEPAFTQAMTASVAILNYGGL
jgi:hypothetical protein